MLIAGIRMKGKYNECGPAFSRLGKTIGRYISGKALCLYYDGEYREEDAKLRALFSNSETRRGRRNFHSGIAGWPMPFAGASRPVMINWGAVTRGF